MCEEGETIQFSASDSEYFPVFFSFISKLSYFSLVVQNNANTC